MKKYITICLITIIGTCFENVAQEHQVEIINAQNEKGFVLSAKNHSSVQQEVTLTLETKNLRGYSRPIKKLVGSGKTVEMVTLRFVPGKVPHFSSSYQFVARPTDAEIAAQDQKLKTKTLKSIGDVANGIILFYKDGCPRCAFVTNYMLDNDIDFKMMDVTDNDERNAAMWELIRQKNPKLEEVIFPVFLVNGDLSYNIEDLKGFTDGLSQFKL